jgi:hypothetical protein
MLADVRRILIGAPLHSARIAHERLSKIQVLAVFSSDALSSVAYATKEILLVLVAAGSAALGLSLPIALVIVALLVVLDSPTAPLSSHYWPNWTRRTCASRIEAWLSWCCPGLCPPGGGTTCSTSRQHRSSRGYCSIASDGPARIG